MMDCKKALVEAEGNFEKAIEILRKRDKRLQLTAQIESLLKVLLLQKLMQTTREVLSYHLIAKLTLCLKESFINLATDLAEMALESILRKTS